MLDFTDKVVLITGAAGNLGQAAAEAFAQVGARLVLADLAEERLRQIYGEAGGHLLAGVDLTDEVSVSDLVAHAMKAHDRIDVLANIAGGFYMGPLLHETPLEDWERMMNLNARSVFLASRAVIPHMLAQGGGRIVSVSARAADMPKGKMAVYNASKAAVITLTRSLAAEHKHDNINANCILPGTIDTPQNRADMPEADHAKWVSPGALAEVILFLASEAARAVNGAAIPVYGES